MTAQRLDLPPRLLPGEAAPLAQALLQRRGRALDLRVGQVELVSTQALQVLLSAARTWRGDGHRLRPTGRSPALEDALRQLGLGLDAITAEGTPR